MSLLQYVLRRQQDLFALCEQIQTIYRGQVREQKISDNCNLKKSSEMRLTSDTVWPDLVSTSCLHSPISWICCMTVIYHQIISKKKKLAIKTRNLMGLTSAFSSAHFHSIHQQKDDNGI